MSRHRSVTTSLASTCSPHRPERVYSDMPYMDAELWIRTWRRAAPKLEAIRRDEVRRTDHVHDLPLFDGVFEYVLRQVPPRMRSGLVEQQRLFGKLRRDA